MGSRSVEKGNAAIASIAEEAPETKGMISVVQLDVQDDASVKAAAESIKASLGGEPVPLAENVKCWLVIFVRTF